MHASKPVLTHTIGGVGIAVAGDVTPSEVTDRRLARSASPAEIILHLDVRHSPGPLRPEGTPSVECDSWAAFVDGDQVHLCVKDHLREPMEGMRLELSRTTLEGRCYYDREWPYVIQYPIDQLLVVHALGVAGGALMHAAAIVGRDGALLVAGPSGAGKTTMSRAAAAAGAHVLSDERTIARPTASGWVLGGTPWPGEGGFAENRSVPLRGLILLEQAERDELTALTPARALALLYRCHFPPLWDPVACERTLGNLEQLVRDVPAFLFRNRKGREAAQTLLARIGGVA